MTRRRLIALLPVVLGFTFAACGNDEPEEAATTTSATTATTAPSSSTTTAMPGGSAVLAPDGLGIVKFGEAADVALDKLRATFGAPRELPSECRDIARVLEWDSLVAYFTGTFAGYHYLTEGGPPLRTEAGIGTGSTVGQLKTAYASKLVVSDGPAEGPLFEISLPGGKLGGYAGGPADTDTVETFFAGTTCGE